MVHQVSLVCLILTNHTHQTDASIWLSSNFRQIIYTWVWTLQIPFHLRSVQIFHSHLGRTDWSSKHTENLLQGGFSNLCAKLLPFTKSARFLLSVRMLEPDFHYKTMPTPFVEWQSYLVSWTSPLVLSNLTLSINILYELNKNMEAQVSEVSFWSHKNFAWAGTNYHIQLQYRPRKHTKSNLLSSSPANLLIWRRNCHERK